METPPPENDIVSRCEFFNCGAQFDGNELYEFMGRCRFCGFTSYMESLMCEACITDFETRGGIYSYKCWRCQLVYDGPGLD